MNTGRPTSTRLFAPIILLLLLSACGTTGPAEDYRTAAEDAEPAPVEPETTAAEPAVEREAVRPDAPIRYTVREGDTLWDIAARFLNDPWVWPEVWEVNPGIENPHLIYPGDVITLAWREDAPRLVVDRPEVDPDVRTLSPEIRRIPLDEAIDAIPADAIRQFLNRPHVVSADALDDAGYIIGNHEGRMISATGDEVFARGLQRDGTRRYNVVRRGQPLIDPETRDVLGYEALHLAEARLVEHGDPARLRLERAEREVLNGDRLIVQEYSLRPGEYIPQRPQDDVDGQIIALFNAITQVGSRQIVVINRGEAHGFVVGTTVGVEQSGGTVRDSRAGFGFESVELPRQRVGTLMVFETFDRLSYALVMAATHAIQVHDHLTHP